METSELFNQPVIYAVLCYVKHGGQTLMLYRNKKKNDIHAGKWNGLGGKMLPGETPEETAHREVAEESSLKITRLDWKGMVTFPGFSAGKTWVVYIFEVLAFTGEAYQSCEEGDLHWIADEAVTDLNLWAGDRLFLKWMQGKQFFSAKMEYRDGTLVQHHVEFYPPE